MMQRVVWIVAVMCAVFEVTVVNGFVIPINNQQQQVQVGGEKSLDRFGAKTNNGWTSQQQLFMAQTDEELSREEKLARLGFTEDELRRDDKESDPDISVNVSLIPDVDAVTLTAVGFGLIAANFFIFANMGDGGIAGIVATWINENRY